MDSNDDDNKFVMQRLMYRMHYEASVGWWLVVSQDLGDY